MGAETGGKMVSLLEEMQAMVMEAEEEWAAVVIVWTGRQRCHSGGDEQLRAGRRRSTP